MNIVEELNLVLDTTLKKMIEDKHMWENFLQYASNMYRYDFFTLVTAFANNSENKYLATYEYWNQSGRPIKKGERTTRALDSTGKKYLNLFDISQTRNNKPLNLWSVHDIEKGELERLVQIKYHSSKSIFEIMELQIARKMARRIEELTPILKKYNCKENHASNIIFESSNSIFYQRIGFELSGRKSYFQDLNQMEPAVLKVIGKQINIISAEALLEIKDMIYEKERGEKKDERNRYEYQHIEPGREENVRGITSGSWDRNGSHERNGDSIYQNGRSEFSDGGDRKGSFDQVRTYGNEILERGQASQDSLRERSNRGKRNLRAVPEDRRGGGGEDGTASGRDAGKQSNQESRQLSGNLAAQANDLSSGGGNRTQGDCLQGNIRVGEKGGNETPSFFVQENIQNIIKIQQDKDYTSMESVGVKTMYKNNIEAVKVLFQLEKENRTATKSEQKILSNYSGWGGLSSVFDENSPKWEQEKMELNELLSESEYRSARASTTTAFYTSSPIIKEIYQALEDFGFDGGKILDPAMGTGRFFLSLPKELKEKSNLYGVEIDQISGRIAKQLHPSAHIQICGYESSTLPDDFDVAIGNIPFGDIKVYDKKYQKQHLNIHDYFFVKTLDKVRTGGLIVFITSKGTLDKADSTIRRYIAQRAELIGAVRLPNVSFKNANTKVTSDILFLQKREQIQISELEWFNLGKTEENVPVNEYFIAHPNQMLGKMDFEKGIYGEKSKYTVLKTEDSMETLLEKLHQVLCNFKAYIEKATVAPTKVKMEDVIPADPNVRNYTYGLIQNQLYYRENSVMYKVELPDKKIESIKEMIQVRVAVRNVIDGQLNQCSDEELLTLQNKLEKCYNKFLFQYGAFSKKENSFLKKDADYPLLCSLEKYTEDKLEKADIFYQRTIRPYETITSVNTAQEGLIVSLTEKGKVDIEFIIKIYGKPFESIVEELKGEIFLNPERWNEQNPYVGFESADEYLSGNVRQKLKIAETFKDRNFRFSENVEALKKVQPKGLDFSEIEVRLGVTWIDLEDYNTFLYELLDTPAYYQSKGFNSENKVQVNYNKFTNSFSISNKTRDVTNRIKANQIFGTSKIDAYRILEDSLNLKTVTVKDKVVNIDGKDTYVINKKETILAREKQGIIKEEFKQWIWKNPERREKYEKRYNELFNHTRLREFDGSHLVFPNMNPGIQLRPHQKNAVARILYSGKSTLLAHCVGAGKSFVIQAAAMELKRIGLVNKSLIIVPNHLTEQMGNEFLQLYPSATILVATKDDFTPLNRKKFVSRIATNEYDAVIIGHSQMEKIPISKAREEDMIKKQIDQLVYAIQNTKSKKEENWSIKQMEKFKSNLEVRLKILRDSPKDDVICFEELGIDQIFCDEAHYYKNCAIFSKLRNVAGVTNAAAKKSTDILMKCQYLQEITNGRGVVFATGTPTSNSIAEMYVMQNYLQREALQSMGIFHFDEWVANFGEVVSSLELAPEGTGYRFKNRLSKFTNLPELLTMYRDIADVKLSGMLELNVPKLKEGKYKIVVSEPDDFTQEMIIGFAERAERIRNGSVQPTIDNMLKITNEARLLGTDPRLLNPNVPNNANSKVSKCIINVYHEYVSSDSFKGSQIIFCDIGIPNGNGRWSVYDWIKKELIQLGMSEKEIAFIHDVKTEIQRDKLFCDVNNGNVRVIIGSTAKLGTGTNIQKRIIALHHLDCPYRPSDIEQREGRGIRQGNINKEVTIYRYVTRNTFDSYLWQIVEQKQKFISQIMTDKLVERNCEDIDDTVLSYAEVKALATGNPLIKEKMDVDTEVSKLKLLKQGYLREKYLYEKNITKVYPKQMMDLQMEITYMEADILVRDASPFNTNEFCIKINETIYTEKTIAGERLLAMIQMNKVPEVIGEYRGFKIYPEKRELDRNFIHLCHNQMKYTIELGESELGNINKVQNVISGLEDRIADCEENLKTIEHNLVVAEESFAKEFAYEEELQTKQIRQKELNHLLELDKSEEVIMDEVENQAIPPINVIKERIKEQTINKLFKICENRGENYILEP